MNNVTKYSDIYQKIVNKLNQRKHLTDKEKKYHHLLCEWFAEDFKNETFTYNESNCGN
jgi:hypothetical protein